MTITNRANASISATGFNGFDGLNGEPVGQKNFGSENERLISSFSLCYRAYQDRRDQRALKDAAAWTVFQVVELVGSFNEYV